MDLLRHGAMDALFSGIRAPSTLGSHRRSYTWGNVRQLEAVDRRLLAELATRAPLLPGKDVLAFGDIVLDANGSTATTSREPASAKRSRASRCWSAGSTRWPR